jgi:excisionase family DNA binding protein
MLESYHNHEDLSNFLARILEEPMRSRGENPVPNRENECLTISVESAAKLLGISRGLAYEMVRQKKIPALHFGRIIRVPRFALDSLLHAQGAGDRPEKV